MDARFAWIQQPALSRLMDALETVGEARFVGGCVRDSLLGLPPGAPGRTDIDIATTATPGRVGEALDAAGIRHIPTGIDHGTVTAVIDSVPYEITTLRSDVSTDGRRASVAFTEDWDVDAQRRDFTINALFLGRDGTVHDCVEGVADLDKGRVRFIGVADDRLREDYLRILRFMRFSARFADGLDEEGWAACVRLRDGLQHLSKERIWAEIAKTFGQKRAPAVFTAAAQNGVLDEIIPVEADPILFRAVHEQTGATISPSLGLASLWPNGDGAVFKKAFKPSKAELDRVALIREAAASLDHSAAIEECLYRFGREATKEGLILAAARSGHLADPGALEDADRTAIPEMPIKGADIMALGMPKGPKVGKAVKAFERRWIEDGFPMDADQINRLLREVVSQQA